MKTLQLTFILILFIISCGESLIEEISESYPNGKPKLIQYYIKLLRRSEGLPELDVSSLGMMEWGLELAGNSSAVTP